MEKARCAVTFAHKNLIGILYERLPKTPKDDVIVQGLAGRACGYNVDDGIIVFTNVPSIERYVTMVDSDFKERDGFTFTGDKSKKNTRTLLYNLSNDIGEKNNVADKHPELVSQLTKRMKELDAEITNNARPVFGKK